MTRAISVFKGAGVFCVFIISAFPAVAADGKAWGGQCVITGNSGNVTSSSCSNDGVSCEGNGRGGTDCSWSVAAKPDIPKIVGATRGASGVTESEKGSVARIPIPRVFEGSPKIPELPTK